MHTISSSEPSRRKLFVLISLAVLLGALSLTYQYMLPAGLLLLALVGAAAAAVGLCMFIYPKLGLYLGIFYIYASLSFYFDFSASHLIMAVVTMAVLLRFVRGESIRLRDPVFNWTIAVFTMLVDGSAAYSLG